MSFNSYRPFKKRNLFPKFFLIFIFGLLSALVFSNALNIVTDIENASQYIKEIILTRDGSAKSDTGIILDGNTSGGRIGSDLYCTKSFDKCINIKGLVQTGDINGFLKTGDLESELNQFKIDNIDPPLGELSGSIIGLIGRATSLESFMRSTTGSLETLQTKNSDLEFAMINTSGDINTLYNALQVFFTNLSNEYQDGHIPDLLQGVDITRD